MKKRLRQVLAHAAVASVAVIGVPDARPTEIIKAFVVPSAGVSGDDALGEEIKALVRARLARIERPRDISQSHGVDC